MFVLYSGINLFYIIHVNRIYILQKQEILWLKSICVLTESTLHFLDFVLFVNVRCFREQKISDSKNKCQDKRTPKIKQ